MINDHRIARSVWKIQINIHVNFISSKDTGETRTYYIWSDNVSIMQGTTTNNIIIEIFNTFLYNYQKELKIIIGREFVFESVSLLNYKLHRVRLKRGGSYIKSPKWLENKKAVINATIENDDECLRWETICALNYNKITKKTFESIFDKIKKEDKDFSSHKRGCRNFEQNNKSTALNILFLSKDGEEITFLYKSEYNLEQENKVLLLMINDDDEKYYYFVVKSKLELHSFEWLRSKKESIASKDNSFLNVLNDSLNYQTIKTHPERIPKLKPYINNYNWKNLKFPSDKEDWKKFEQNNKEIALNVLFVPHDKKEIEITYKSKYNYKHKKQVILLLITNNNNKWHYLAVKGLTALFRGITSNHHGDFYCLNCFHSYRTLNKFKQHERICNNHDYCYIDMPK